MFYYHDQSEIDGGMIKIAVLRSDMAPIPETLEIDISLDANNRDLLKEGNDLYAGPSAARAYRIVLAAVSRRNQQQGIRQIETMSVTAVLRELQPLTFVRETAIHLENTTLTDIYRACGAELQNDVQGDITIPVFECVVGDTPTFAIAKIFQEQGGILRSNNGTLEFIRLEALFDQEPSVFIPANISEEIASGFIERHEIPWFVSADNNNGIILGNNTKPRHVRYVHAATEEALRNMTRVLIRAKRARIDFTLSAIAGSLAELSDESKYTVLTAAHVYSTGVDGNKVDQHTRLWLGELTGTETGGGGVIPWEAPTIPGIGFPEPPEVTSSNGDDGSAPPGEWWGNIDGDLSWDATQELLWAVLPENHDNADVPPGPLITPLEVSMSEPMSNWEPSGQPAYEGNLDLKLLAYYPRAVNNRSYIGRVTDTINAHVLFDPEHGHGIWTPPYGETYASRTEYLEVYGAILVVEYDSFYPKGWMPSNNLVYNDHLLPEWPFTKVLLQLSRKAIFEEDVEHFIQWVRDNAL